MSVKWRFGLQFYRSLVAFGRKSLRKGQFALKNVREDRHMVACDRKSLKRGGRSTSFLFMGRRKKPQKTEDHWSCKRSPINLGVKHTKPVKYIVKK